MELVKSRIAMSPLWMPIMSCLMTPDALLDAALSALADRPGFVRRPDQEQLARLISDCIGDGKSGAFEAPTGLGKSLAALLPALAHAWAGGKRVVVATYTNVLAEQYWRSDLPLAMSLFETDAEPPKRAFLIGRQRYVCAASLAEASPSALATLQVGSKLGVETEFRDLLKRPARELTELWNAVAAPPVCPGRMCPVYDGCWYYSARRAAETAGVVITNHSVVLQDALLRQATEGELSLLGKVDLLVLDEAHDFAQAALNALEFEISPDKLHVLGGIAGRLESALMALASKAGEAHEWAGSSMVFRTRLEAAERELASMSLQWNRQGILAAEPEAVWKHPQMAAHALRAREPAEQLARNLANEVSQWVANAERNLARWRSLPNVTAEEADAARDTMRNYAMFLREFADQSGKLFDSGLDLTVTYASADKPMLRRDTVGLAEPLRALIWDKLPTVSLSATLALDGNFDFFNRTTGAHPDYEEILPSPFDYASQAAVYLPPAEAIPDPSLARKTGIEDRYFDAVARELAQIIQAVGGRTLALFHSRREMEAVHERIVLPPDLPILTQRRSAATGIGEKFRRETKASLFALRSFWTGFDAPGETLSCVAIVRVPFEVPVDPPQIARMAWLQTQGLNGFAAHSLPNAKMLMRQGVGRLIRRADDRGIIALLDPRLTSKNYGEEILANLPPGIRIYRDVADAVGAVGID